MKTNEDLLYSATNNYHFSEIDFFEQERIEFFSNFRLQGSPEMFYDAIVYAGPQLQNNLQNKRMSGAFDVQNGR